ASWWQGVGEQATTIFSSWVSAESSNSPAIASPTPQTEGLDDFNDVASTDDPAPHISNLTLVLSPDYGERKGLSPHIIKAKKARVQAYLDQYAGIAQQEMKKFGIPASITLAQGLLESNAGDSKLAVVSKNHFGIKCRKKCLGCTCRNYGDDTRYDMFRVFDSAAESFREHSELLNTARYARLKGHGNDYEKWAHGLKACGYATDKRYGYKLIAIIKNLGLDQYDV
ncbi:MAG: glucosaminidase domain-containing protein, partial [Bacteroidota bacterium]